jgi:hypothetical protein
MPRPSKRNACDKKLAVKESLRNKTDSSARKSIENISPIEQKKDAENTGRAREMKMQCFPHELEQLVRHLQEKDKQGPEEERSSQ